MVVRGGLFDHVFYAGDDEVFGVAEAGEGCAGGVGYGRGVCGGRVVRGVARGFCCGVEEGRVRQR